MVFGLVTPQNSNTPEDERDLYQTPQDLFEELNRVYGPFMVDAAANSKNHKCPIWFGPGSPFLENALANTWCPVPGKVRVFCNPPWSRGNILAFMRKAMIEHSEKRALTTFLLPATTDVRWFHDFCWDSKRECFYPWLRVFFITPRIRYVRPDGSIAANPGMGSMVVSFRDWNVPWNLPMDMMNPVSANDILTELYQTVLRRAQV